MKKYLILFIGILILGSCTEATIENSIENPKKYTTIELQELVKDTVLVAYKDKNIYIFKDDLIVIRGEIMNKYSMSIPIGLLIFFILSTIILLIIFINWIA